MSAPHRKTTSEKLTLERKKNSMLNEWCSVNSLALRLKLHIHNVEKKKKKKRHQRLLPLGNINYSPHDGQAY